MKTSVSRNAVVELLGTPQRTLGSVNDPREQEENGTRFNDKWIYTGLVNDPSGLPERVICWHRYDFTSTRVRSGPGSDWRDDSTLENALSDAPSRLAPQDESRNKPVPYTGLYHPVSEFPGKPDLGGHV